MTDVKYYLSMLKSRDPSERLAACRQLEVATALTVKGVDALLKSTRDSNSEVAEAARRALQAHVPASKQTNDAPSTRAPFWEDGSRKLGTLILLILAEFILTLHISPAAIFMPPVLWLFPLGLLFWIPDDTSRTGVHLLIGLGWLSYLGLGASILWSRKKLLVRNLFIALILLLLINAGGCWAIDSWPKNV